MHAEDFPRDHHFPLMLCADDPSGYLQVVWNEMRRRMRNDCVFGLQVVVFVEVFDLNWEP